jgi:hypothetical protein
MQIFIDTATNHVHHFDDDVVASPENGIYTFKAASGMPLEAPATLQPYTPPEPTRDELLANARQLKISALMRDCSKAIVAGFESSALGSEHDYPYMPTDQNNLAAAATASLSPGLPADWTVQFWCADGAGVWSHATHTAAQIQQVMADGVAHRTACSAKYDGLVQQVNAAQSVADIEAIAW